MNSGDKPTSARLTATALSIFHYDILNVYSSHLSTCVVLHTTNSALAFPNALFILFLYSRFNSFYHNCILLIFIIKFISISNTAHKKDFMQLR